MYIVSPDFARIGSEMTTLYLTHDAFLGHKVPEGHPERPDRLRALRKAFDDSAFAALLRSEAPLAASSLATLAHPAAYVRDRKSVV